MSAFTRFILVVVVIGALLILVGDYIVLNGDLIIKPLTGDSLVNTLNSAFNDDGKMYLMFMVMALIIAVIAIAFKYVRG
jgi:hypothetical protein